MPDFFRSVVTAGPAPLDVAVRLAAALLLGAIVSLIYRTTRPAGEVAPSFTATLVLLAVLIAMVTQVIGDNVARAFSLVGALSIVRFRTVVRDTQDTAYVIFSVGVGMAAGAGNLAVGAIGIVTVAIAAAAMRQRGGAVARAAVAATHELQVRVGIGHDTGSLLGPVLDAHVPERFVASMSSARQGMAVEVTYRAKVADEATGEALVRALNRLDGVQGVGLTRLAPADDEATAWRTP
jgi:uncharacterized membrane protein YhiD involved in acid resistance